jgi:hypothetical protein
LMTLLRAVLGTTEAGGLVRGRQRRETMWSLSRQLRGDLISGHGNLSQQ